jgi:hypothetical protein
MPHSLPPPKSSQIREPLVWMIAWSCVAPPTRNDPTCETPRLASGVVKMAITTKTVTSLVIRFHEPPPFVVF